MHDALIARCDRMKHALVGKIPGQENNVPQGGVVWVFAVKK